MLLCTTWPAKGTSGWWRNKLSTRPTCPSERSLSDSFMQSTKQNTFETACKSLAALFVDLAANLYSIAISVCFSHQTPLCAPLPLCHSARHRRAHSYRIQLSFLADCRYLLASALREMESIENLTEAPRDCNTSGVVWQTGKTYFEWDYYIVWLVIALSFITFSYITFSCISLHYYCTLSDNLVWYWQ